MDLQGKLLFPIGIITCLVYANAFSGDFHYDDYSSILSNGHLTNWETFAEHLDHMVRPFLHATFLIDRSLYGNNPAGYHLLNLLLHLGSGLLVYGILTRAAAEDTKTVPLWTALLFLLHPIQTETVTYILGRASGLMAFCYLLTLFLYIKAAEDTSRPAAGRLYRTGAGLCFLLSIASKEPAITFPLALLLWDVVVRRLRGSALRAAILSHHSPFWLISVCMGILAWLHPRYADLAQFSLGIRPLWDNLLSELHAVTAGLLLFLCPWKQNFDHDLPLLRSLFEWPLPLELLAWSGLSGAAVAMARQRPLISFSIGWFALQMLPTTIIPRSDLLSERNLYLASIGVLLVLVFLGTQFTRWLVAAVRHPRLIQAGAGTVALALICGLSILTYQRNALYRDPILLWSDTVEKSPQKARPHNNLGHAYLLRDDWERAIEEFRIAVRLDPDYALAQKNLRAAYLHRSDDKISAPPRSRPATPPVHTAADCSPVPSDL